MKSILMLATIIFFSFSVEAMADWEAKNIDAAALFNKHCSACHHEAGKMRADANIVENMRNPLPAMPRFDRDKINDRDALAIADFIRNGGRDIKKAPQPEVASSVPAIKTALSVTTEQEKVPLASKAIIDDPAHGSIESAKPHTTSKPTKNKKSWVQNFVKKWYIKGMQNDEMKVLHAFEVTSNKNQELAVVPLTKLSDYTIKVTDFEIIDKTLKLQFTWSWKNNSSYWKVETFELTLSDDGKKLSGLYNLRAVGSVNTSRTVWGEQS
jgi:hypothetical protein